MGGILQIISFFEYNIENNFNDTDTSMYQTSRDIC